MSIEMNKYLVMFRPEADVDASEEAITAHRVEGWTNDYAFFGHPGAPGVLTELIPRELVVRVIMKFFRGDRGQALSSLVIEAEERQLARRIREAEQSMTDTPTEGDKI